MKQLYLLSTLAMWWLLMLGGALLLYPRLRNLALAALVSTVGGALLLFWVEHFQGLGQLYGWMPLSVLLAACVVYWRRQYWAEVEGEALAFVAGFLFALAVRMLLPDINAGSSENLTNLAFLNSYRTGATLPPPDMWLAGRAVDMYYAFQHYCGALMGRLFKLTPGMNYYLAFCTVVGLTAMTAWSALRLWQPVGRVWVRALAVLAFVAGGTGVSPFSGLIFSAPQGQNIDEGLMVTRLWANVRFSGSMESRITDPAMQQRFDYVNHTSHPDAPIETMGWYTYLGDYHASLGGYPTIAALLLLFTLLIKGPVSGSESEGAQGALARRPTGRLYALCLGLLTVLPLASNVWVFPLLVVSVGAFAWLYRAQVSWLWLALGAGLGVFLLQPFLTCFTANSMGIGIALAKPEMRMPLAHLLLQQWPIFVLCALGIVLPDATGLRRKLAIAALLLTVFVQFFVLTPGGNPDRFNTSIKWGSWAYSVAILGLGGVIAVASEQKWARYIAIAVLALAATFVVDIAKLAMVIPRTNFGQLDGDAGLKSHDGRKTMLTFLRHAPKGVVLEPAEGMVAYSPVSQIALLAEQPSLVGWGSHEGLWRVNDPSVGILTRDITAFFKGEHPQPVPWLLQNRVRYILLPAWDDKVAQAQFDKITAQISSHYIWREMADNPRMGVWIRRQP